MFSFSGGRVQQILNQSLHSAASSDDSQSDLTPRSQVLGPSPHHSPLHQFYYPQVRLPSGVHAAVVSLRVLYIDVFLASVPRHGQYTAGFMFVCLAVVYSVGIFCFNCDKWKHGYVKGYIRCNKFGQE